MMNENGKAPIIAMVCSEASPPIINKMHDKAARIMPHRNLIPLGGFNEPFEESIEITKVAESADVIKKIAINTIPAMVVILEKWKCSNKANKPISLPLAAICSATDPSINLSI